MLNKILPFLFLLTTVYNCPLFTKQTAVNSAKKEQIRKQIENVDCDDADRLEEVKKLYKSLGANKDEIKVVDYGDVKNVIVTVRGKTDETVVVGGHYDKTTLGCGVIDNWSGIVLIANLYESFKKKNNKKTYKFVAFGKEEKGLIGSKAMVKAIPLEKKSNYCAMVNFDSFGFTNLWTLESISDRKLIELGQKVAKERGQVFQIKNFRGASSDSKSFQKAGIPSITVSGLGDNWRKYLHQDADQLENISFPKIYENYTFSIDYLEKIDSKSCDYFK